VREQFFMLLLDREAALAAIPTLFPDDPGQRRAAFAAMHEVLTASEDITGERAKRLQHIAELFGVDATQSPETRANVAALDRKEAS